MNPNDDKVEDFVNEESSGNEQGDEPMTEADTVKDAAIVETIPDEARFASLSC